MGKTSRQRRSRLPGIRRKKSCSHRIASAGHMPVVVGFLLRIRVEAKSQTKQLVI